MSEHRNARLRHRCMADNVDDDSGCIASSSLAEMFDSVWFMRFGCFC